jgi:hypothetical protein
MPNEVEANPNERMPAMKNPISNEANHHPVEEEANYNTPNEADVHRRMLGQLMSLRMVMTPAEIMQQLSAWQRKKL